MQRSSQSIWFTGLLVAIGLISILIIGTSAIRAATFTWQLQSGESAQVQCSGDQLYVEPASATEVQVDCVTFANATATPEPPTPTPLPTATPIVNGPTITAVVLVDAISDTDIGVLTDDMTIDLDQLNTTAISVRAEASAETGSVSFVLNGALVRTENVEPYTMYGDRNGNYYPDNLTDGTYVLELTPYSGARGTGTAGPIVSITFSLVGK